MIDNAQKRVTFVAADCFTDFQVAARNAVKCHISAVLFENGCAQKRQRVALRLFDVAEDGVDAGQYFGFVFKSSGSQSLQSEFFLNERCTALAVEVPVGQRCQRD